jgi:hypothetical protein
MRFSARGRPFSGVSQAFSDSGLRLAEALHSRSAAGSHRRLPRPHSWALRRTPPSERRVRGRPSPGRTSSCCGRFRSVHRDRPDRCDRKGKHTRVRCRTGNGNKVGTQGSCGFNATNAAARTCGCKGRVKTVAQRYVSAPEPPLTTPGEARLTDRTTTARHVRQEKRFHLILNRESVPKHRQSSYLLKSSGAPACCGSSRSRPSGSGPWGRRRRSS